MNVHEPTGETPNVPVPAQDRDVRPADPVYDAELVDEPVNYTPRLGWFASWWLRSPRVPAWLKSRRQARQAFRDLVAAMFRAPFRFVGAVVRGMVTGLRGWRRWVTVRDFREAAESAEKLADKFAEIRALTLFRWKVTGAVAVASALGLVVADLVYGSGALWIASAAGSVALAVLGRRKDGSPGR